MKTTTPMSQTKQKIMSCPSCKKPLPRCAVCLGSFSVSVSSTSTVMTRQPSTTTLPMTSLTSIGVNAAQQAAAAKNVTQTNAQTNASASNQQQTAFGDWFSWCQKCRHGGHAVHMMEWFEKHPQCPVTDCKCTVCATSQ